MCQTPLCGQNDEQKLSLKDVDKIRERFFEVSEDLVLAKKCFPEDMLDVENYPYAYVLYLDEQVPVFLSGFLCTALDGHTELGFKENFKRLLRKVFPMTFFDTLLLLDLYCYSHDRPRIEMKIEQVYKRQFPEREIVDDILAASRGILLWYHQMEMLIHASSGNMRMGIDEVIALRRAINAKKAEAWNLIKSMKIENGISLYDIFRERMILFYTVRPNIHGAISLYRAINLKNGC